MTNLIPSNRSRTDLSNYKASLSFTEEQRDIILGTCLGDLNVRKIGKFSRLVFEQKNQEYLFHLYAKFSDFTRTPPKQRLQQRLSTSEIKST